MLCCHSNCNLWDTPRIFNMYIPSLVTTQWRGPCAFHPSSCHSTTYQLSLENKYLFTILIFLQFQLNPQLIHCFLSKPTLTHVYSNIDEKIIQAWGTIKIGNINGHNVSYIFLHTVKLIEVPLNLCVIFNLFDENLGYSRYKVREIKISFKTVNYLLVSS